MKNIKLIVIIAAASLCGATSSIPAMAKRAPQAPAAQWRDPRVDVGIVKIATGLFAAPSASSAKINGLVPHEWTVLVSRQPTAGWYPVIQFTTGRQGWVRGDRLIIRYTNNPAQGVDLQTAVTGTQDPPTINVTNDSSKYLFLHLQDMAETAIEPHGKRTITLTPGFSKYNAAFPGLVPLFGEKVFVNGSAYTWRFYVETGASTRATHVPVNPALKAETRQLQQDINTGTIDLNVSKQLLEAREAAFNSQLAKLKADEDALSTKRATLDHSDQAAVNAFNEIVDATNAEKESARDAQAKYDAAIADYNAKLHALNKKQERLEEIVKSVNSRE